MNCLPRFLKCRLFKPRLSFLFKPSHRVKYPTRAFTTTQFATINVAAVDEEEVQSAPQLQQISKSTQYRTHTCGELRLSDVGKTVKLTGWVQKSRDKNTCFVDLRDRYGITQIVFDPSRDGVANAKELYEQATHCGREFVIQIEGKVIERPNKNPKNPTGNIEIVGTALAILNESETPPFKIQDETDGKELLRMKYRYLDIRRNPVKEQLLLRNEVTQGVRRYLHGQCGFVEVETPVLIKSTPEGARDFVVPSRMNPGQFYALPQSPQTFKQILMVAGMDRYFQIVKCFRDEELRADRQPEFTQIDCEMTFVSQDDVLSTFEGMISYLFKQILGFQLPPFERMTWQDAMDNYGIDKPDLRYDMKLHNVTSILKGCGSGLAVLDNAEIIVAIKLDGVCKKDGPYSSKKKIKKGVEKLATSQVVGAGGCIWINVGKKMQTNCNKIPKESLEAWAKAMNAEEGDLVVAFSGPKLKTQECMGKMRHEMGTILGLRDIDPENVAGSYRALWVVDFPLLEFDEEEKRFTAMHHPFTSPKPEDQKYMESDPGRVRANAYDMVINGVEVGGGSIRIHDQGMQHRVFELLGFTKEQAEEQFGFLLNAFTYGAPPHGGLAFGLARLSQLLGMGLGLDKNSIRDYIAFPKNNQGRCVMIDAPSLIDQKQMEELCLQTTAELESNKNVTKE